MWRIWWLGAVVALLAALLPGAPAQAQSEEGVAAPVGAATVVNASTLAARLGEITDKVAGLQQRRAEVENALATARQRTTELTGSLDSVSTEASLLIARARQQAFLAYVHADPASTPFALAAALTQGNVNDVAWSLGLLRISQRRTVELARRALDGRSSADQRLVAALTEQDRLELEAARLGPAIEAAKNELALAQLALEQYVERQGTITVQGLTTVAYQAYQAAAQAMTIEQPACGLRWELLAAIGKTESNHGAGRLDGNGEALPPILGIPIGPDTDRGELDTDPARDHAVGPMQFIPSTWRAYSTDGNGDGIASINNIWDQTLAAARYLCRAAGSLTLATRDGVVKGLWAYNPSQEYVRVVGARFEALAADVAGGWFSAGDLPLPSAPPLEVATGGGDEPVEEPAAPVVPTQVVTVSAFTATGLAVPAATEVAGTCDETSALLAGRTGFLRCLTTAAEGLDPCQVAPYDLTLAACLPDPRQPARLVRSATPLPFGALSPPPPHAMLVLDGGDVCTPLPGPTTRLTPPPPPAPGGAGPVGRQSDTSAPTSVATTTTAVATTATPTTGAPTTPPPTTAATTTPPPQPTTAAPTTPPGSSTSTAASTSTTSTTVAPTTTTVPAPPGATYRCTSGAFLIGQPVSTTPAWTIDVLQAGIAQRAVTVRTAYA